MQALKVEAQYSRLGMNLNGVRATIISNRSGVKAKGAERFLVLQYEEAPLAFRPSDWKLMLI
jgi:hypothetical protein